MSFASETKNELINLKTDNCCARAELSALIRINGVITISQGNLALDYQTQNAAIARRVVKLIKQLYGIDVNLLTRKRMKLNKGNIYIVRVPKYSRMVIDDLGVMNESGFVLGIAPDVIQNKCCKRAYLRGAFLASGSVNNPETASYHLEIFGLDKEYIEELSEVMNEYDLNSRVINRSKGYIVYIKESEKISDFLRIIQANNAVLEFEDVRILRDMHNSVNRIRNCEIANLNKSWSASREQIDNIRLIDKTLGLDILNEKLYEIALLRIKYPEATMQELSEYSYDELIKGVSKSGINHRVRKINEFARRIRECEENNQSITKEEIEKFK